FDRRAQSYDDAVVALNDAIRRGLRTMRHDHGFKRKDFAKRLGIPLSRLARIEQGRRKVQAGGVLVFAFALDESTQWLMEELSFRFRHEIAEWSTAWRAKR